MGRHSTRTVRIENAILAGLSRGIPLAELCRRPGMPCPETWRNWCRADDDLDDAYAAARALGLEAIMGEVCDALMDGVPPNDPWIEGRMKLAAKWTPYR